MRTYYAYIRVSTVKQGEHGSSLQEQRAAIDAFAKRQGLAISEYFEEQETAAKQGRTQFRKMLAALERGKAHGVIMHKIDRGARNLRDWADLGTMADRGIEIHFANENLDLTSRGGRLSADIQAVVAADFIRNLREEVKKGMYGRLKQGFYPLYSPLGYIDNGSAMSKTICPRMGPFVRNAFELYATGNYTLTTLQHELKRRGLRNKRGGVVTKTGLSGMLNNPFYYGLMYIKRTKQAFAGSHEPIISKRLFDRVQELLNRRTKVVTGIKRQYLFQRMIRCRTCARGLYAELHKGIIYYRCQSKTCPMTSMREDTIMKKICDELMLMQISDTTLQAFGDMFRMHAQRDRMEEREDNEKSLTLALTQISIRLERLTDAYIDQRIDREDFDSRKTTLENERIQIKERLQELSDDGASDAQKEKHFLELLKSLQMLTQLEDTTEKRNILKNAISNFFITRKSVEIAWDFPLQLLLSDRLSTCCAEQRDTSGTNGRCSHVSASPPSEECMMKIINVVLNGVE